MSLCHTPCHQLHSNPPITSVPLSSLVCYGAKTARDPLVLPDCASCNMEKQLGPTASLYSASLFLWSSARIHTHTHTYAQTLPLLCSNSGSIATHKCTRTGSEGTQRKKNYAPNPSRAVSEHRKKNNKSSAKKKRVPCSAFRCARPWREKNQTGRDRENIWEQRHTNTTVVLSLCMLCRDGKPWRSHWKEKSFPERIWKLSAETDEWLIIKRAPQHGNVK